MHSSVLSHWEENSSKLLTFICSKRKQQDVNFNEILTHIKSNVGCSDIKLIAA